MINIDIRFGNNYQYKISFRDSLLILLSSLSKLAKSFGVEAKGNFNFKSVDNLNVTELNDYALRNEIIAYASLDCKILFDILIKFNQLIFELYNLSINKYPTLPSLAFGVFRSKYLKPDTIPLIKGQPFHNIKNSYTGGSVDVIINHGFNVYGYDINSLYPYSMSIFDVPMGDMKAFTGNIWNKFPDALGFFEVIVDAPKDLNIPVLQIRHNNQTISPVGKFKGWFFSEELRNAIDKFGYKIEILNGYIFDRGNIFKNYVTDLYNLRLTYDKTHPMNLIAKILMNSLYGRFGLNIILNNFIVIEKNELDDLVDHNVINDLIDLDHKFLISVLDDSFENSLISSFDTNVKSNIAVASSITAYSRMILADIKKYCLDNNITLFYFDTDSAFTSHPLPDHLVGKDIGQWTRSNN